MIHPDLIRKQRLLIIIFSVLLIITMIISMGLGDSSVSYGQILPTLLGHGSFKETFVLLSIRLPRILITILGGMALAVSGAILQSISRNDLADPGIIGINAGAGLAITIFFLFMPIEINAFIYVLPVVAFAGALLTAFLIYIFSYNKQTGLNPSGLILVGVGFAMALSGAMIVLISSAKQAKVNFISQWLAGDIWGTSWPFIWAILPWLLVLIPFTIYKANRLNILTLSEQTSIGVGLSVKRERITLLLTAVALAAAAVSVTGGIAFIGLIAPHMAKALIGSRHQLFLPIAALLGGWLLLLADTIGRNLVDNGIPAGIMTALIGAPYFIYLLMRRT